MSHRPVEIREASVSTRLGRVAFRIAGSGPAVVLLHSNGHSWREFTPVLQDLAQDFEVFAWDQPGHGDSEPCAETTGIDEFAAALEECLEALSVERAVIVGCSVGGMIAASIGARDPDRVAALAMIETHFGGPEAWSSPALWEQVERTFAIPTQDRAEVAPRFVAEISDDDLMRWNIDRNRAGSRTMMGVMKAIAAYDIAASAGAITVPTLALFGDQGPTVATRPAAESLLGESAEVVTVEAAGHFVTHDRPVELAAALRRLLARS